MTKRPRREHTLEEEKQERRLLEKIKRLMSCLNKGRRRAAQKLCLGIVAGSIGLFGFSGQTVAQNIDWAYNGIYWNDTANWVGGVVPTGANHAVFNSNVADAVYFQNNYTVGSLDIYAGQIDFYKSSFATGQTTLTLDDGGNALEVKGAGTSLVLRGVHINAINSGYAWIDDGASMTLDGSHAYGAKMTNAGPFFAGYNGGGTGTMYVNSGGELITNGTYLGFFSGSVGTTNINGATSTWNNSGFMNLGYYAGSTGSVNVNAGSVTSGSLYLGGHAGAAGGTGNVTVNNGGSFAVSSDAYLWAGGRADVDTGLVVVTDSYSGSGFSSNRLFINDGTFDSTVGVKVATTGQTGFLEMVNNGYMTANGFVSVGGDAGTGTMRVLSGSDVANTGIGYLGYLDGGNGTALVSGTGSTWTNTSLMYVGRGGMGDLTVSAGGYVRNTSGRIGFFNTANGLATVTGSGSRWENTGSLVVGQDGSGTLNVNDGGLVESNGGVISSWVGSSQTNAVNVDGSSSRWINSGNLDVGVRRTGTLNITNSGVVVNQSAFLGDGSGGNGVVNVNGNGSTWTSNGDLFVAGNASGAVGSGSVDISNLGRTLVDGNATIWSNGTVDVSTSGWIDVIGNTAVNGGNLNLSTDFLVVDDNASNTRGFTTQTLTANAGTIDLASRGVAVGQGNNGTMTLSNNSNLTTTSFMIVGEGNGSEGSLTIQSGSDVTNGTSYVRRGSAIVAGSGSSWTTNSSLTVGGYGQPATLTISSGAEKNVNASSTVGVDGTIHVVSGSSLDVSGSTTLNGGTINVNGSATFDSGTLVVGNSGIGNMNVTSNGRVTSGYSEIGNFAGSVGTVTVGNGSGSSRWDISNNLRVGDNGTGQLNINSAGTVTVSGSSSINSSSSVTMNNGRFEFGTTDLDSYKRIGGAGGTLAGLVDINGYHDINSLATNIAIDQTEVSMRNSGVIYGDGATQIGLNNLANGELRTRSNEWARFGGNNNSNQGEINNFGGTVEFEQQISNGTNGFISGRGIFIADQFNNDGVIAMSGGFADFHGDIANSDSGTIAIGGGSTTTFYDDVTMDAANMNINVSENSNAVFFGSYNGGNDGLGTVHAFGDLRPGNSPGVVTFGGDLEMGANTLTYIELAGTQLGEFDRFEVGGDLKLNGDLDVQLIDGFSLLWNQEYAIADIAGQRFGEFANFAEGDLIGNYGGIDLFISYMAGDGNDVSFYTAIPEPSSLVFAGFGLATLITRRRRKKS